MFWGDLVFMFQIKRFLKHRKYKKKVKKKRTINFKTLDPGEFLRRLESHNIPYVVLRWPEEVLEIVAGERYPGVDIDVLVDVDSWETVFFAVCDLLVSESEQSVKFDVYSVKPTKGFLYQGLPYFPEWLSLKLLEQADCSKFGFRASKGPVYIQSLVYHLLYQKAELSGLPLNQENTKKLPSKRDYSSLLVREAERHEVSLPVVLTVESLYRWLCEASFEAPYDLVNRYELNGSKYLHHVVEWEESKFRHLYTDRYVYVFMLRDSIENTTAAARAIELIERDFTLLHDIDVKRQDRSYFATQVRGGNWYDRKLKKNCYPYKVLVVEDESPVMVRGVIAGQPLVDNEHYIKKLEIRDMVQEEFSMVSNFIHGTDNRKEAAYVIGLLKNMDYL